LLEPPAPVKGPGVKRRRESHDPAAETRRIVAAMDKIRLLLDAINWVYPDSPGVLDALLSPQAAPARDVIGYWLRQRGCDIVNGRGRNAGKIITPVSSREQWNIGMTLSCFRQLFDFWAENIRPHHNPMQMDPKKSRLSEGQSRKFKNGVRRWWLDVDGMFRTRHVDRQAPRPGDQDAAKRILDRGRQKGWPEEVHLLFEGQYLIGSRIGQLRAATAYGLLVKAKSENHIALIQKGSRGSLTWHARTPPGWRTKVLAMLAKRVKGGLKQLMRMAKSKDLADIATLKSLFIFSVDGKEPVAAWRCSHLLRQVVEELGMRFQISCGAEDATEHWFTSQWFRHMFVNRILDRIAESSLDGAGRKRARDRFADYMGWQAADAMLAYYGRFHFEQEVDLLVAGHQDDLNAALWDELGEEAWSSPANDNTIWPQGMVVGGDLLD
jgi:hypothetical protein